MGETIERGGRRWTLTLVAKGQGRWTLIELDTAAARVRHHPIGSYGSMTETEATEVAAALILERTAA